MFSLVKRYMLSHKIEPMDVSELLNRLGSWDEQVLVRVR